MADPKDDVPPLVRPRFDHEALYVRLDKERRKTNVLWRDIARAAGVSASTFTRLGHGHRPDADTLVRLLVWLGETDIGPYMTWEVKSG